MGKGKLIYANDVLEAIRGFITTDDLYGLGVLRGMDVAIECIEETEGIDPESLRLRGKWHKLSETKLTKTVECTHCNWSARFKKEGGIIVDSFLYCPSCGAEMKGATENG